MLTKSEGNCRLNNWVIAVRADGALQALCLFIVFLISRVLSCTTAELAEPALSVNQPAWEFVSDDADCSQESLLKWLGSDLFIQNYRWEPPARLNLHYKCLPPLLLNLCRLQDSSAALTWPPVPSITNPSILPCSSQNSVVQEVKDLPPSFHPLLQRFSLLCCYILFCLLINRSGIVVLVWV